MMCPFKQASCRRSDCRHSATCQSKALFRCANDRMDEEDLIKEFAFDPVAASELFDILRRMDYVIIRKELVK